MKHRVRFQASRRTMARLSDAADTAAVFAAVGIPRGGTGSEIV